MSKKTACEEQQAPIWLASAPDLALDLMLAYFLQLFNAGLFAAASEYCRYICKICSICRALLVGKPITEL